MPISPAPAAIITIDLADLGGAGNQAQVVFTLITGGLLPFISGSFHLATLVYPVTANSSGVATATIYGLDQLTSGSLMQYQVQVFPFINGRVAASPTWTANYNNLNSGTYNLASKQALIPGTGGVLTLVGVLSFNGRTGVVIPQSGDYSYSMISGTPVLPGNTPAVSHEFLTSYNSSTGVFGQAQPAIADLSDGTNIVTITGTQHITGLKTIDAPILVTPQLGVAQATTINNIQLNNLSGGGTAAISIHGGKTFGISNSITFTGTDSTVFAFPSVSGTVVTLAATQTISNKLLDSSNTLAGVTIGGAAISGGTISSTNITGSILTSNTYEGLAFVSTSGVIDITIPVGGFTTSLNISANKEAIFNSSFDLTGADMIINPSGATSGQVLGYNGSNWVPVNQSGGGGITLETNGATNSSQTVLNLVAGTNVTLSESGGSVTINASGGSGSPGGSNTQVQFNNSGSFGGNGNLTLVTSGSNSTLSVGGAVANGLLALGDPSTGSGEISTGSGGLFVTTPLVEFNVDDFQVNISAATQFEIDGNGTWLVTGAAGTSGNVLTSQGPGTPPIWAPGGGTGTVTTTGSPASGNLTKFSGASSVTNGDLSGDVTTSGTLATTLATVNANVGAFTNANITVNAKGLITAAANGSAGGSVAFSGITAATNTTSAMVVGTGASLTVSGSGTINATSLGGTAAASYALLASPTFTTPTLGAASATSINKVAITAPATSATLTIVNAKTLTVSNSLTLAGTDATTMTFPTTTATIARTDAAQTFTGTQTFGTIAATTFSGTPNFSGAATGLTATLGTNTTQLATTAFVIANAGGGSSAFSAITGSTNTTAAMVVGAGATLTATSTGLITATNGISTFNQIQKGAKSDGATNDSTAVQSMLTAISSGATPYATFTGTTSGVTLLNTAITDASTGFLQGIIGMGNTATQMLANSTNQLLTLTHITDNNTGWGFDLINMGFAGAGKPTSLTGTQNLVALSNANTSGNGTDVSGAFIKGCQFFGASQAGFKATSPILMTNIGNTYVQNGIGQEMVGNATTITNIATYANDNLGDGYLWNDIQAGAFIGTAADANGNGYRLIGCEAITFVGIDSEIGAAWNRAITTVALTSNVATITLTHNFTAGQTVLIKGGLTTNAPLNGWHTISTVTGTTSFTFALTASNISSNSPAGMTASVYTGASIVLEGGAQNNAVVGSQQFTPADPSSPFMVVGSTSGYSSVTAHFNNSGGVTNDVVLMAGSLPMTFNVCSFGAASEAAAIFQQGASNYITEECSFNGSMPIAKHIFLGGNPAPATGLSIEDGTTFAYSGNYLSITQHNSGDTGNLINLSNSGTSSNDINATNWAMAQSGKLTKYSGHTLAGQGTAPILSAINLSAQGFAVFNTAAAVNLIASGGGAGTYRVSVYAVITTTFVTNTAVVFTIGWTDDQGARTFVITGGALTAGTTLVGSQLLRNTGAAAITYTPSKTGTAATAGAAAFSIVLEQVI